jgi:endonuclease-3 related protein
MSNFFERLFVDLMRAYGPQGWWPVLRKTEEGSFEAFYHCEDFSYPHGELERFQICVGAILTQNTSWKQANKALIALAERGLLGPEALISCDSIMLGDLLKPAGYFNTKSRKLREFSVFWLKLCGRTPTRDELLNVWGVGPETADSMLLYAWRIPSFVIDAYTRRILDHYGVLSVSKNYNEAKKLFEENLTLNVEMYQEYHALLVEHAKRFYSRKPWGVGDPLSSKE